MPLRFLPQIAAYQIFQPNERKRPQNGSHPFVRATDSLPDVPSLKLHEPNPRDPSSRLVISRRTVEFKKPKLVKGFEDYGKVLSLTVEEQATEHLAAGGKDKWTRDASARRQVIIARNPQGLAGNSFNKYCTKDPTTITSSVPLWDDGSNSEYRLDFEPAAAAVVYMKEPFTGLSLSGEHFKSRLRQAAVSSIIRNTPARRSDRTIITFVNPAGLFAPGYRPRLQSGMEINLKILALNADGGIAGFAEI